MKPKNFSIIMEKLTLQTNIQNHSFRASFWLFAGQFTGRDSHQIFIQSIILSYMYMNFNFIVCLKNYLRIMNYNRYFESWTKIRMRLKQKKENKK